MIWFLKRGKKEKEKASEVTGELSTEEEYS